MGLCTISGVQENEHPRATSLTILGEPTACHLQSEYIYHCMFHGFPLFGNGKRTTHHMSPILSPVWLALYHIARG